MTPAIIKAIILSVIVAVSDTSSSSISASLFSLAQFKNAFVVHAFVIVPSSSPLSYKYASRSTAATHERKTRRIFRPIMMTSSSSDDEATKEEISRMRVKEIRNELESMNISTKSFFEKGELIDALMNARKNKKEGSTAAPSSETTTDADDGTSTTSNTSTGNTRQPNANDDSTGRQERIAREIENCKTSKVSELKKELESAYGISSKSFLEKSEFVRAVAEARVDGGPPKRERGKGGRKGGDGGGGGGGIGGAGDGAGGGVGNGAEERQTGDPSFRDVVVSNFKGGKSSIGGNVIDVRAR
mmetsp:Transcript_20650/g.32505  ORF Transcript_20650/g.32505 Transcript_20650/m.32505 type:complete len:301 (+) Transcript_20650:195-1097(+)